MGVQVLRDGRLVEVVLNRPPINALDGATYDALTQAFGRATRDDVVLLRSVGRHFCTGQDLAEHTAAKDAARAAADLRRGAAAVIATLRCAAPVVVAIQGAAVGAGALLACAADAVLMSDAAWLSLPELQVGVTIGGAVAERTLGAALARRMLLTGERATARAVEAVGGARVVAADELRAAARAAAEQIAELDPSLVHLVRRSWGGDEREATAVAYEREIEAFLSR